MVQGSGGVLQGRGGQIRPRMGWDRKRSPHRILFPILSFSSQHGPSWTCASDFDRYQSWCRSTWLHWAVWGSTQGKGTNVPFPPKEISRPAQSQGWIYSGPCGPAAPALDRIGLFACARIMHIVSRGISPPSSFVTSKSKIFPELLLS